MTTRDTRIVLHGREVGEVSDQVVDHPGQPRDYFHTDGTVWTWQGSWRIVGGADLRVYDLMTHIALRVLTAAGDLKNPIVDHPGQPADYFHTDGTVWTWQERWRPLGGGHFMRVYDLVLPGTDPN